MLAGAIGLQPFPWRRNLAAPARIVRTERRGNGFLFGSPTRYATRIRYL
jgi:hypothetical protein